MNVLHKTTSALFIEREITALYTSFQEIQEPWLLALSLGAKQCHGCEIPSTDPLANMSEDAVLEKMNDPTIHHDKSTDSNGVEEGATTVTSASTERPRSFPQSLKLFSGRYSSNNFFLLLYRSIILTFHPTILWVSTSGLFLSWPVGISYTAAAFLTLPPYNFSAQGVADMYLAAWLGMIVAVVVGSIVFGWVTRSLAHRNRNIYEPEFLLFQVIPGLIFAIIGMVGWGWGEQDGIAWIGLAWFFALVNGGAVMVNNAVIGYVIDAHREYANESQVIIFSIKAWRVHLVY